MSKKRVLTPLTTADALGSNLAKAAVRDLLLEAVAPDRLRKVLVDLSSFLDAELTGTPPEGPLADRLAAFLKNAVTTLLS